MSEVREMIQRAKEVRERLRNPPNAVPDTGINLYPHKYPSPPIKFNQPIKSKTEVSVTVTEEVHRINRPITFMMIMQAASEYFNIGILDLKSRTRKHKICRPRQVVMYLCRKLTRLSTTQVAKNFDMDHTTVMHGTRYIELLRQRDDYTRIAIEKIEENLRGGNFN